MPAASLFVMSSDGELIEVSAGAHPRARRLRLSITAHGPRLSYPVGTHARELQAFLERHVDWMQGKCRELQLTTVVAEPRWQPWQDQPISWRGQTCVLHWRAAEFPRVVATPNQLVLELPATAAHPAALARGLLHSFFEAELRREVAKDLAPYVARLGRAPSGLRVLRLKSLWGSLDTRDRVSLDLSLAMAPAEALRYVLVHELCHLRVRNHSPAFWAEVETLLPDWREQRLWLRQHGARIKREMDRWVAPLAT